MHNRRPLYNNSCFKSYKQEPYVMVKRSTHLPEFDERFVNFGKYMISWIEHLRYSGYRFAVLKYAFAVDIPHPRYYHLLHLSCRSDHAKRFFDVVQKEGAEKWEMNILFNTFKKELAKTPDRSVVYICDESNNTQ